jgi:hypothetical protein
MLKLPDIDGMYRDMAEGLPRIVHCDACGREQQVNPSACLRSGWPICCGKTMKFGKLEQ